MFCDIKCLLCDQDQKSKINYSFYHGVCNFHKPNLNPITICHYCSSNVPVNKIIDISRCNNCSNITIRNSSPCGHILCEKCEKDCFICKNKTIDLFESLSFQQQDIEELPKIQSLVSEDCYSENPEIIHLGSSMSIKVCQYCRKKITFNFLECNHFLCDECLIEKKCKLCELLANEYSGSQELIKSRKNTEKSELNGSNIIPHMHAIKESQDKNLIESHEYDSKTEVIILPVNKLIKNYALGSTEIYPDESFFINSRNLSKSGSSKKIPKPGSYNSKDSLISKDPVNELYKFEFLEVCDLNQNTSKVKMIEDATGSASNSKNSSFNTKKETSQPPATINEEDDDEKCCCTLF